MSLHYYVSSSNDKNIEVIWAVDPKQNDYFKHHVQEFRSLFRIYDLKKRTAASGINLKWFGKLSTFRVVLIIRFDDLLNETARYFNTLEENYL